MYVSSPTWLEFGPATASTLAAYGGEVIRRQVRPASVRREYIGKTAGLGSVVPQLSKDYCASYWSLLNPVAWAGGCVAADANDLGHKLGDSYESIQYGHIPRPGELPQAPIVGLPPSGTALPATAVQGSPAITADDIARWNKERSAAIAAAEKSGSYNPAGNLPTNMLDFERFWNDYGTYVIFGSLALAGLFAWKAVAR
jgi:hypothetical protein